MTLPQVPAYVGNGNGWQFSDYQRASGQTVADSTGAGTVALDPVDAGQLWQVTRAVISASNAAAGCSCRLYVTSGTSGPAQTNLNSGTNSGNFDEADYPGDGLPILEGEQLQAVWTAALPGALLNLTIVYRLLTR